MSELFERLRPWLEEWIRVNRVPAEGPLDIKATAERSGLGYLMDDIRAYGRYLRSAERPDPCVVMKLRTDQSEGSKRLTYGHEIGHYFIEELKLAGDRLIMKDVEEDFCERFAVELVIPTGWLKSLGRVSPEQVCELAGIDSVEYTTEFILVCFQMWQADMIPKCRFLKMRSITGIDVLDLVCLSCESGFRITPACECGGISTPSTPASDDDIPF